MFLSRFRGACSRAGCVNPAVSESRRSQRTEYEPDTPRHGKRTDAPAPATEYDYDVSIRLNCSVYVGRYLSGIDYLPDVFSANQSVEVSLDKHFMYVKVPGSRDVKMGIVRTYAEPGDSCGASR